jgi:hypothetical protein
MQYITTASALSNSSITSYNFSDFGATPTQTQMNYFFVRTNGLDTLRE